ncbi:hypothetical protein BGZ73_002076 [Actinomortierella ambigua]|nr:hypothetical protein BGZ73_002076 [Actinomortierella ambigua]
MTSVALAYIFMTQKSYSQGNGYQQLSRIRSTATLHRDHQILLCQEEQREEALGPHRALLTEELLMAVLAYATAPEFPVVSTHSSTNDETASTISARKLKLVCRRWNRIVDSLMFRQWSFTTQFGPTLVEIPTNIQRLCCNVVGIVRRREGEHGEMEEDEAAAVARCVDRWEGLMDCLRQRCSAQQPLTLRELCIRGKMRLSAHVSPVLEIAALGRVLTLLELRWQGTYAYLNILAILQVRESHGVPLPHLRHFILQGAILVPVPEPWDPGFKYDLASLYLDDCKTSRTTVVAIVHALTGRSLQRLHLMDLQQPPGVQNWWEIPTVTALEDAENFLSMFPQLTLFEIQIAEKDNALETVLSVPSRLPKAERVVFGQWVNSEPQLEAGFYPPPSPVHYRMDRHLTRLEISGTKEHATLNQLSLDKYLKSKEAQTLQELVVTMIEYDPAPPISYGRTMEYWACEGLRVLDMAFQGREQVPLDTLILSRQLFGFIVVNCPRLCELRITRRALAMGSMGGLCLTSRLASLERLTLCSTAFVHWVDCGETESHNSRHSDHRHRRRLPHLQEGSVAYGDPRWVISDPTYVDIKHGISSLKLCRKVATTDNKFWSWMLRRRGKELLWPGKDFSSLSSPPSSPLPLSSLTDNHVVSKVEKLKTAMIRAMKKPLQQVKANKGCCWIGMRAIRIEGMAEDPGVPEAFGDRLRDLLQGVGVEVDVRRQGTMDF